MTFKSSLNDSNTIFLENFNYRLKYILLFKNRSSRYRVSFYVSRIRKKVKRAPCRFYPENEVSASVEIRVIKFYNF